MKTFAFRLKPGNNLKKEIDSVANANCISAGCIATAVGGHTTYNIWFANQPNGTTETRHFKMVSLTGTLFINGYHIHISVADSTGKTIGGHGLEGNIVYTTAGIVLQSTSAFTFSRQKDGTTPWHELQIKST